MTTPTPTPTKPPNMHNTPASLPCQSTKVRLPNGPSYTSPGKNEKVWYNTGSDPGAFPPADYVSTRTVLVAKRRLKNRAWALVLSFATRPWLDVFSPVGIQAKTQEKDMQNTVWLETQSVVAKLYTANFCKGKDDDVSPQPPQVLHFWFLPTSSAAKPMARLKLKDKRLPRKEEDTKACLGEKFLPLNVLGKKKILFFLKIYLRKRTVSRKGFSACGCTSLPVNFSLCHLASGRVSHKENCEAVGSSFPPGSPGYTALHFTRRLWTLTSPQDDN